jgi:hypothetical protein
MRTSREPALHLWRRLVVAGTSESIHVRVNRTSESIGAAPARPDRRYRRLGKPLVTPGPGAERPGPGGGRGSGGSTHQARAGVVDRRPRRGPRVRGVAEWGGRQPGVSHRPRTGLRWSTRLRWRSGHVRHGRSRPSESARVVAGRPSGRFESHRRSAQRCRGRSAQRCRPASRRGAGDAPAQIACAASCAPCSRPRRAARVAVPALELPAAQRRRLCSRGAWSAASPWHSPSPASRPNTGCSVGAEHEFSDGNLALSMGTSSFRISFLRFVPSD